MLEPWRWLRQQVPGLHLGSPVKLNRRSFALKILAAGGVVFAGGGTWVATSRSRGARWLRQIAADARRSIAPAPVRPTPETWNDNAITLAWLGHATVLINFYGIRILTDPALGARVGVWVGLWTAGPKRYIAPALRPGELPPIDLVLLSHAHMDHIDVPTLRRLPGRPFTITAIDTQDILPGRSLGSVVELRWNEAHTVRCPKGDLHVKAFEVKHWGQRWPSERPRGYNGYILTREGKSILFGGDTAMTPLFGNLRSKGPFQAAVMPIAAYNPWIRNHCTPEEALQMVNAAGAAYVLPVHHETFRLSREPMSEPMERLRTALSREPERLGGGRVGETFVCPG